MALSITINGVEAKDAIKKGSLKITDQINDRADSCQFVVEKTAASGLVPLVNQEVIVTLDGDRIFGGVIITIDESVEGHTMVVYEVQCKDWTHQLDRMLITERFEGDTGEEIIDYLVANYTTGFTANNVTASKVITSVAFNGLTMSQALQKLARMLNYSWYVDYNKDIHFFAKSTELAPISLADDSDNFIFESLQITRDISQIRNSIFVRGGEAEGDERTETYVADAGQSEFPLANKFAGMPEVLVNSVAQTTGVDFLSDPASYEVLWNFNQKYIKFTAGNEMAGGEVVEITGVPLYPILVHIPSPTSMGEFGEFQFKITDKTIKSRQEAIDRALAELDAYAATINEASFSTYEAGLKSGQVINIQSDLRSISEDFVIQKVQFVMRSPTEYQWQVELATLKTVGIVDILQRLLLDEELTEGEQETLLTYMQFSDSATIADSLTSITTSSPPYVIDDDAESQINPVRINFSTIYTG